MVEASLLERSAAWLRERVQLVDAVLAGLFVLTTVIVPAVLFGVLTLPVALISLGLTVPLAWRRTAPVAAAAVVTLFGIGELLVVPFFLPANLAVLVTLYSLAGYAPR